MCIYTRTYIYTLIYIYIICTHLAACIHARSPLHHHLLGARRNARRRRHRQILLGEELGKNNPLRLRSRVVVYP